jgi:hypothetical protein
MLNVRDLERRVSRLEKKQTDIPQTPQSAAWSLSENELASLTDAELDTMYELFQRAVELGKMDAYGHTIGPDSEECVAVRATAAAARARLQQRACA